MAEPTLREGASGADVRELQLALREIGQVPVPLDGQFGPQTLAAVKAFQQKQGIAVDGVVGTITWRNIDEFAQFDEPTIKLGSTGLPVRRAQNRLTLAGYDTGGVDGVFGSKTDSGVRALQHASAIEVDGIVGPETWKKIDALGD